VFDQPLFETRDCMNPAQSIAWSKCVANNRYQELFGGLEMRYHDGDVVFAASVVSTLH
jgi:hypothetical protein